MRFRLNIQDPAKSMYETLPDQAFFDTLEGARQAAKNRLEKRRKPVVARIYEISERLVETIEAKETEREITTNQ